MNLLHKIEELRPLILNCNAYSIYDYDCESLQELLCVFFTKINDCVKSTNGTIELVNWMVSEGLSKEVAEKLLNMIKDGTIENLINSKMFGQFNEQLTNLAENKADKTNISSLQSQINNLVVNGTGNSNPEVIQARANFLGLSFSTLSERIMFIENAINGTNFPLSAEWEVGGINTNNGIDVEVSDYIRTKGYLSFKGLSRISFNLNNCRVYLIEYTRDGKVFIRTTEKNSNFVITNVENYFRIVVAPPSQINIEDVKNYLNIYGNYIFKEIENLNNLTTPLPSLIETCNEYLGNISYMGLLKWEIGGIIGSTGVDITNDYAVRSDYFTFNTSVKINSVKEFYCIAYQQDGTFIKRIDPVGDNIIINDLSKKYRIVVSNGYGNTINNIESFLKFIEVKSLPKFEEKVLELVNTGNISSVIKDKIFNCLGDSITSTDYTTPNWWQIISNKTGSKFNNYGVSGTCLAYNEYRETNFGKCFVNRYKDMSDIADGIIVMGGTNDYEVNLGNWDDQTEKTFYGGLNLLIKGLLEKYKGKPIIFMTPIQQANDYQKNIIDPLSEIKNGANRPVSLQLRAEAIKCKCKQYGITCIDLYNNSGINGVDTDDIYYRAGDQTHPSEKGQKVIANELLYILNNKFNIKE